MKKSGFTNVELNYQPTQLSSKPKKSNARKALFCNLPWNMALKRNVGKEFLSLLDMFKGAPQGKYINSHKVKLSCSTMRNFKSHITSSNQRKLKPKVVDSSDQNCKCNIKKSHCPLRDQRMVSNVVYQAVIKTEFSAKSCIGMTGPQFITRWREHRANLKYKH